MGSTPGVRCLTCCQNTGWSQPRCLRFRSYNTQTVFYASDLFNPHQNGDHFRDKVAEQQVSVDEALRSEAAHAGLELINIPRDLCTTKRVDWITARLTEMDLLAALT
jgi:hypothetical protein